MTLPKLRVDQILEWADAYYARTGAWPTPKSGSILEAPEETWSKVNSALCGGTRGFRGFSSLARLLRERPGSPPDAAGDSSNAETRPPAQML